MRRAARSVGEVWTEADIDQACRTALKAGAGELARITLVPLSLEAAAALGDPFMAPCAPAEVFFPMTDILNVALVQMSSEFKLADLSTPGDSARFPAFKSQLDRLGTGIEVTSPGGLTNFVSRQGDVAVVDWSPDPMAVAIVSHGAMNGTDQRMRGVERYAFRLEIDARSGALIRAATPSDRLDLIVDVPGLSPEQDPRIVVTREVSIETAAAASSATQ